MMASSTRPRTSGGASNTSRIFIRAPRTSPDPACYQNFPYDSKGAKSRSYSAFFGCYRGVKRFGLGELREIFGSKLCRQRAPCALGAVQLRLARQLHEALPLGNERTTDIGGSLGSASNTRFGSVLELRGSMSQLDRAEDKARASDGRIVGIGASAGGLESLEQLFSALPADTGMAFIVVQHLSPDFRSLMDELIGRHSDMPVVVAVDGMTVEANHIYLMPPGKEMMIRDRHLWLTDKVPHTFSLPIDAFFRSLAQDVGPQAVAVVLSGSGSDGSRGIVDVKRAGGLVMAETSATAKFDGMPLAAGATGVVDHTHAPRDISRILCGLPPLEAALDDQLLSEDPNMDAALKLLRDNFGIDFSLYKMTTVGRRIQRRVELLRVSGFPEYVDLLMHEPEELHKLYQDLLIGVTQFFRDPEAFDAIERDVIPKLLEQLKPEDELRVWIAGCATGEEAYSLAMLFSEAYAARDRPLRLKILATDVHQRSLDFASVGIYGEDQLGRISAQRLEKFFTKRSSGYQIATELRQLIVFARHNVTKDPPFTKMHFISCRNMLIYLQPHAQRSVLSLFHFGLVPGGTLFLGASETPGPLNDEFTVVEEHWKVYRKRRDVHLLNQVRLPIMRTAVRRPIAPLDLPRTPSVDPLVLATYDQLLDLFMPPGLLIDENGVLIDAFGGAEKLMQMKPRRPRGNALDLLDDEVRTIISGAMQRALKDRRPISYADVRVKTEHGEERRIVTVQPLIHPRTGANNILITFRESPERQGAEVEQEIPTATLSGASMERLTTLESELQYTRETLQATIEELETSNEEMQATNEELVASNEELQSTNEELHSVNEELYTVNAEYQQKIGELKELNSDMAHLLEGTDVGTVFLDRELRIRRFTSRIANVFRFQHHDIGRRIGDFSHNIEREQLMDEIEEAFHKGVVVEAEVRDRAGTPYFLRILPYRVTPRFNPLNGGPPNGESSIEGVVLTLTDMTALEKERTRVEQLSAIVEWSDDAILALDLEGTITSWNRGAERCYGYTAEEAIGKNVAMLMEPAVRDQLDEYLHQIADGKPIKHAASISRRKNGGRTTVSVMLSPIFNREKIVGAAAIARDIGQLVETQRALEEEQRKVKALLQRREEFLAMLSHELRNPLAAVLSATTALEEDETPARVGKCRVVIKRQATLMKRLLDDMLDVSRITAQKFTIQRDPHDLREAIDTAIESTAPIYAERRIKLEKEVPARQLPVHGDARRLTQMIGNLLANAAIYSPVDSRVSVIVTTRGDEISLLVRDQGEGIELDLQTRIFDLFVQSEQKLDRSRGGLGVGLSLAKTIAELHGGAIRVTSEGRGKGSEFEVTLPMGRSMFGNFPIAAGNPASPCRIVLVDDQDDSRDMLRDLLEARKHVVYDAADGARAVQLIAEQKPDVAFIDIGLPVMDGFEVAQQIRQRPELREVRLVALSGYGNKSDVAAALKAGFDEHVTKPAELGQLEKILARLRAERPA
ncbi:MAG TPA: chemotaxis protein CheB [Kofleriaceae bacterium]|nr:chemotaxis protein CheB [Kofleriaceae bacterium]